jgi:hypothetical protein
MAAPPRSRGSRLHREQELPLVVGLDPARSSPSVDRLDLLALSHRPEGRANLNRRDENNEMGKLGGSRSGHACVIIVLGRRLSRVIIPDPASKKAVYLLIGERNASVALALWLDCVEKTTNSLHASFFRLDAPPFGGLIPHPSMPDGIHRRRHGGKSKAACLLPMNSPASGRRLCLT